jgi:hypothetical protein
VAVGYATYSDPVTYVQDTIPFIWSQNAGIRDLRTLTDYSAASYSVSETVAINDVGQILCYAYTPEGFLRSLLLTPYNARSAAVTAGSAAMAHLLGGSGGGAAGGVDALFEQVNGDGELSAEYAQLDPDAFALAFLEDPAHLDSVRAAVGDNLQVWDITFTGEADGPITLTLRYDAALLPAGVDESVLGILHYVGGLWESLPVLGIDPAAQTITVRTDTFSPFVLAIPEPATAMLLALGALGALGALAATRGGGVGRVVP